MDFGIHIGTRGCLTTRDNIMAVARSAEAFGYAIIGVADHLIVPVHTDVRYPYTADGIWPGAPTGECFDAIATLTFLAGFTQRIRLLTSVLVVPHRPAVLTAKLLTTADVLSGGRVIAGIGSGWMKEEFAALQTPAFEHRGAVTDEYIQAWKALWTEDVPSMQGRFVNFDNVVSRPKPVSQPHPPIWVGGESAPALRRAATVGDGWYPVSNNAKILMNTPALLKAGIDRLHRAAEQAGRDPGSIDIAYVWFMPPDWTAKTGADGQRQMFTGGADDMLADAAAFAAVGVKHLIVYAQQPTIEATLDVQQRFAEDVSTEVNMTDLTWLETAPLPELMAKAAQIRDEAFGRTISYSRKVFIPLTKLCRDVCHYCTFAERPRAGHAAYLSADEVLAIARAGEGAGCTEALFTLGDKPELRYRAAREALAVLGHETTIGYLREMCALVLKQTSLIPHVNPGVMTREEIAGLREVSGSQGIMLESTSERLCHQGGVHYGSPDKLPAVRLETIRLAGELAVPFTTGILIGIGETRAERLDALMAIRDLHLEHGHIQEVIVQNFRAKPDTKLANADEPDLLDLLWTIAAARLILPVDVHVQAPPNLSPGVYQKLIGAGIDDWGGVSPVTPDHVNPEAPWPELEALGLRTAEMDKILVPRLPVYPAWVAQTARWLHPKVATRVMQSADAEGWARDDDWAPGLTFAPKPHAVLLSKVDPALERIIDRAAAGKRLDEPEIVRLFGARDIDYERVITVADELRKAVSGNTVRYVVNRNINYTNICYYRCKFCAFSKGKTHEALRGTPYDLEMGEIVRRSQEAWDRGATEVCLQGGIHPDYTGDTYVNICKAIKAAIPGMHIHAFSPLEVTQGAATLGLSLTEFLTRLKDAGLSTLPGTAAEILDDEVRAIICPDKINTQQWVDVARAAHGLGLRTTSTIMYGHIENALNWARHLLVLRDLQAETGGFTEFVPLPFVHMEAPMYLRGMARKGPTLREAVLMHAVARLVLNPLITNIQTSWVKMGPEGAALCLNAGANDLGGTLMNESISRAAGTQHGQEFPPEAMEQLIGSLVRTPAQRDTLYRPVGNERRVVSFNAPELAPVVQTPPRKVVAAE